MDSLFQDLRYTVRTLLRRPGFAAVVVLTLALGIGANTAIYSVVDAALLGSLPFGDADRLVYIGGVESSEPGLGDRLPASAADWIDFRERSTVFEEVSLHFPNVRLRLTGAQRPEEVRGMAVSQGWFEVMGVEPSRGRAFTPDEDVPGEADVVVLSHGLWQRLGGDPDIVGTTIRLSDTPVTVVGVLPESFTQAGADVLVPLALTPEERANRRSHFRRAFGRLKPGVNLEQAQAEMSAIARDLAREYPETNAGRGVNLVPIRELVLGPVGPAVLLLQAVVALVLLIACANVANLMLARMGGRRTEIALREALGAGRRRVIQQLLTESVVLALIGGAVGIALAAWTMELLVPMLAPVSGLSLLGEIGLDARVLLFALALSVLTGLSFGVLPAFRSARVPVAESLKQGVRAVAGGGRLGGVLVGAQAAISLVLLIGAGLMARSFVNAYRTDLGFDPANVLTMRITRPGLEDQEELIRRLSSFYAELTGRLTALPGVEAAGLVQTLPMVDQWTNGFEVEGWAEPPAAEAPEVEWRSVSPGYFSAMGIPLVAGRDFERADDREAAPVAIINQSLARRYFGDVNPIGRRLRISYGDEMGPWSTVVGVVGAVAHRGVDEARPIAIYQPVAQVPVRTMRVVVRADADPLGLAGPVRDEIWAMDPEQPVAEVQTMRSIIDEEFWGWRFSSTLLGGFSLLALALALAGLYGVLSHVVSSRMREIGIRISLGAGKLDVFGVVFRKGMLPVVAGIVVGLAGAAVLSRLMRGMLFGISPIDPLTYAGAPLAFVLVALLAIFLPARRAAAVDPATVLREE